MVLLPYDLYRVAIDKITDFTTFLFSNLNASKVPYVFDGKECKQVLYIANSVGTCNNIFTLITMDKIITFAYFADEKHIKNP